MYFVVECSTTSAPRAIGCCRYGEANVLSTNSFAPAPWASSASPAMSAMASSGFVGVSHQISLVCGRSASRTASRSPSGTVEYVKPHGTPILSTNRKVPP